MTGRYRVWDGATMHEPPHEFFLRPDGTVFTDWPTPTDFVASFYTGLDDSEGTPIYEGDIIQYFGEQGVVQWAGHVPGFTLNGSVRLSIADPVVIGNRYENPDLLEQAET